MSKDDVMYAVAGINLGVILGFIIANSTTQALTEAKLSQRETQASVNSSSRPELPPGHPDVGGGRAQPSGGQQLPAGHPDVGSDGQPAASSDGAAGQPGGPPASTAAGSTELPSLVPLPAVSEEQRAVQQEKYHPDLKGVP